jgi:hypothetical protein
MFVPKLGEEEARYFLLCFLSKSAKGQGEIAGIRNFISLSRAAFGEADMRPNPTRSNAPFWYQICQNASDRVIVERGYVVEIQAPPNKVLRITDKGRNCVRPYIEHFQKHPSIESFKFFDNALLSDFYGRNPAFMKKFRFNRETQFFDFIKSKSYAMTMYSDREENRFAEFVLDGLEANYSRMKFDDDAEKTFRLEQLKAWRESRGSFPDYEIMRGTLT